MTKKCMMRAHFKSGDDGFRCELGFQTPAPPGWQCPAWVLPGEYLRTRLVRQAVLLAKYRTKVR